MGSESDVSIEYPDFLHMSLVLLFMIRQYIGATVSFAGVMSMEESRFWGKIVHEAGESGAGSLHHSPEATSRLARRRAVVQRYN
jgi:hypothetical protein